MAGKERGSGECVSMQVFQLEATAFDTLKLGESVGELWGAFRRVGKPVLREFGGQKAVFLDGKSDMFEGPLPPAQICGNHARTIEVWVWKDAVRGDEEAIVAWGRRGGPAGANLSLNWGRNGAYGGVTHWAADMGWRGVPKPTQWHHLVYTYDGKTARLYDNGAEKNALEVRLNTPSNAPIRLGVQNAADGSAAFKNEFNGLSFSAPMGIATVRIHDVALSPEQVSKAFEADRVRFRAEAPITLASIRAGGVNTISAGGLTLTTAKKDETLLGLVAETDSTFDFLPTDRLAGRFGEGFSHLGDVTVQATGEVGAIKVARKWVALRDALTLQITLTNVAKTPTEVTGLGVAMVFNNILSDRSLDDAHEKCAFTDPYPGGECGYLQVTRLSGKGPALLVLPERGTHFEAYRHLKEDATPRDVTNEGFYEWTIHSKAWAEGAWKDVSQWNTPTSRVLGASESVTYGLRFVLSASIREIEATLRREGFPVVMGIPGFVLPTDQTGKYVVSSKTPLKSVTIAPENAAKIARTATGFTLSGRTPGRSRLTLRYADGRSQFVHLFVTPPSDVQTERLGKFHAEKQWYDDKSDPFERAGSFLNYDNENHRVVLQRNQVWMAGLSDEMGAGPAVAVALKNLHQPDKREVALLESYVDRTLWGKLQGKDYGIRASLFYFNPQKHPNYYTIRGGWDEERTKTTWRAYNYPHQAAVYWSLYHLARNHVGIATAHPWEWYLRQAYKTTVAMRTHCGSPTNPNDLGLAQFGLMVGSVFFEILKDLKREGFATETKDLETYLRARAEHWRGLRYPYGSEMPWDSTGQEEVYTGCEYFGFADKAKVTQEAVLAYTPIVPNWAYNGASRRYFDAPVNGTRWPQIGRMTLHYGSALNAIALLAAFRRNPTDLHLLRAGYAGAAGPLANIATTGFASYGFDATPEHLDFDPFTADYGVAFYGVARNCATYAVQDPQHGWLAFGGEVTERRNIATITPKDAFRQRIFLATKSQKLWLTLDAGQFQRMVYDALQQSITLTLAPKTEFTPIARLRADTGTDTLAWAKPTPFLQERGAWVIPLSDKPVSVTFRVR
jgi:hypothetical protein